MKKNKIINYLEYVPCKNPNIDWKLEDKKVILEIENTGLFNKIAQIFFKKPKISYVHLDELGSFVWPLIDEKSDITAIGVIVEEHFGDKAAPIYERLAKFFQILESYGFVKMK